LLNSTSSANEKVFRLAAELVADNLEVLDYITAIILNCSKVLLKYLSPVLLSKAVRSRGLLKLYICALELVHLKLKVRKCFLTI